MLEDVNPDLLVMTEHKMSAAGITWLNVHSMLVQSYFVRKISIGGGVVILSKQELN